MANARETALRTLLACRRQGAWSDGYLKKAIREDGLDRRDAALATRLCFGVLQNQLRLDWYLAQFSRIPLNKLEEAVLCILRLALYQLQAMDRVPDSAAVNEAVKLARKYSRNPRSAGLCVSPPEKRTGRAGGSVVGRDDVPSVQPSPMVGGGLCRPPGPGGDGGFTGSG